jgi:hypothetical protein
LPHSGTEAAQKANHPQTVDLPNMTTMHANPNRNHLSEAFNNALAAILRPHSPRNRSQPLDLHNLTQAEGLAGFRVFQLEAPKPGTPEIKSKTTRAPTRSSENVCLQCKTRKKQVTNTSFEY